MPHTVNNVSSHTYVNGGIALIINRFINDSMCLNIIALFTE